MIRVSAGIVTYKDKILLMLRDNNPVIHDPNKWSLIGGHLEEGETPDKGLLRELEEEIGIRPKNFSKVKEKVGHWKEKIYIYHVPLTDDEVVKIKKGNEGQKVDFFELSDLENLPKTKNLTTFFKEFPELFKQLIN